MVKGCTIPIALIALLINFNPTLAQLTQLFYTGPEDCPSDPSVLGYTNTTTLQNDILLETYYLNFLNLALRDPPYIYTLCPNTVYDLTLESYIVPFLNKTYVICGVDGSSSNSCIFEGGDLHVLFTDEFIHEDVHFMGITFRNSSFLSIGAFGNSESRAHFVDCHWEGNNGPHTVLLESSQGPETTASPSPSPSPSFTKPIQSYVPTADPSLTFQPSSNGTEIPTPAPSNNTQNSTYFPTLSTTFTDIPTLSPTNFSTISPSPSHTFNFTIDRLYKTSQYETKEVNAMYLSFGSCSFVENENQMSTVTSLSGVLAFHETSFVSNSAIYFTIGMLYQSRLFLQETEFISNFNYFGTVFIDHSSHLQLNDMLTSGDNNTMGNCQGIQIEQNDSLCMESDFDVCTISCCEFGDDSCDVAESSSSSPAPTTTRVGSPTVRPTVPSRTTDPTVSSPTVGPRDNNVAGVRGASSVASGRSLLIDPFLFGVVSVVFGSFWF